MVPHRLTEDHHRLPDLRCVRAFFYFMDRSRTKVLSQHFAILFSSAHTGASFCSTFLICPASQRDPQCPPQCDCFRTQKISGTSRHPFLNVSGRCFMPLAFRRKYSLITTSLRCHDLPCPWNLFQLDRRSWVTARLEHSELLNDYFDSDVSQIICCTRFLSS